MVTGHLVLILVSGYVFNSLWKSVKLCTYNSCIFMCLSKSCNCTRNLHKVTIEKSHFNCFANSCVQLYYCQSIISSLLNVYTGIITLQSSLKGSGQRGFLHERVQDRSGKVRRLSGCNEANTSGPASLGRLSRPRTQTPFLQALQAEGFWEI